MSSQDTQAHIDHLRWERDHARWSADHMKALAVLRRVEAHLYAHEAHTIMHRVEIASHDESLAHGSDHLPEPLADDHHTLGKSHDVDSRNHTRLMDAIFALENVLD